jgi:hypothetical protein
MNWERNGARDFFESNIIIASFHGVMLILGETVVAH